jgi:hypothetical protein
MLAGKEGEVAAQRQVAERNPEQARPGPASTTLAAKPCGRDWKRQAVLPKLGYD